MAGRYLIYGGSGGIGSATARALHGRGDQLHLVGRNEERLAAVAGELGAGYTAGDATDGSLFARVAEEAAGRSVDALSEERDRLVTAMLKATRDIRS